MSRLVYLGPPGTFAEMAVEAMPGPSAAEAIPEPSVFAALDAVRTGDADAAVVPIENSVEGSVSGTLDELAGTPPLRITGEIAIPVRFVLMRRSDAVEPVRAVGTHAHAAAQCRRWLRDNLPDAQVLSTASTAGAARELAENPASSFDAAISTDAAARRYGLTPVAEDIADNPEAVTRFVRVERPGRLPEATGADKTSLVLFIRANRSGALLEILTELAVRGINMTRLESRPTRHALGDYCFSVDLEGHAHDARMGEALVGLRRVCADILFLGSYPRWDGEPNTIGAGQSDTDYAAAESWLESLRRGEG